MSCLLTGAVVGHLILVCSSEFFGTNLQKITICHTNCNCQADDQRQGPWTSGFTFPVAGSVNWLFVAT